MTSALTHRFLCLTLLVFAACGTGSPGPNPSEDAGDSGQSDAMTTEMGESADVDGETDAAPIVGELQLGTTPAYETMPENFTLIVDGAEVPLTFGVQGSWMVVLAFRTRGMFDGMLDVRGTITVDGTEAGNLWLELQQTFPGGDGWDYYYNFFLAIDHKPDQGTPAHIVMTVTDENGTLGEVEHDVLIGAEVE